MVVLNRWEHLCMNDHQEVVIFMQQVCDILCDLKSINQVQSHEVVYKLLNRLPRRFDKLMLQIQSEKSIPTLQELWNLLHIEEINTTLRQTGENQDEALLLRIRNLYSKRQNRIPFAPKWNRNHYSSRFHHQNTIHTSTMSSTVCYRCGTIGHTSRYCRAPTLIPYQHTSGNSASGRHFTNHNIASQNMGVNFAEEITGEHLSLKWWRNFGCLRYSLP